MSSWPGQGRRHQRPRGCRPDLFWSGDDHVYAGAGADRVSAGSGADFVADPRIVVTVLAGRGDDVIRIRGTGELTRPIVDLRGGPGADLIVGGSTDDDLRGGAGRDVLRGGGGFNSLYGEEGRDVLKGGSSNEFYLTGDGDVVIASGQFGTVLYDYARGPVRLDLQTGRGRVAGFPQIGYLVWMTLSVPRSETSSGEIPERTSFRARGERRCARARRL